MFKAFNSICAVIAGLAVAGNNVSAACFLHHGESSGTTAEDAASEAVAAWVKEVTAERGEDYADWRLAEHLRMVCDVPTKRVAQERGWFCSVDGEARRDVDSCAE